MNFYHFYRSLICSSLLLAAVAFCQQEVNFENFQATLATCRMTTKCELAISEWPQGEIAKIPGKIHNFHNFTLINHSGKEISLEFTDNNLDVLFNNVAEVNLQGFRIINFCNKTLIRDEPGDWLGLNFQSLSFPDCSDGSLTIDIRERKFSRFFNLTVGNIVFRVHNSSIIVIERCSGLSLEVNLMVQLQLKWIKNSHGRITNTPNLYIGGTIDSTIEVDSVLEDYVGHSIDNVTLDFQENFPQEVVSDFKFLATKAQVDRLEISQQITLRKVELVSDSELPQGVLLGDSIMVKGNSTVERIVAEEIRFFQGGFVELKELTVNTVHIPNSLGNFLRLKNQISPKIVRPDGLDLEIFHEGDFSVWKTITARPEIPLERSGEGNLTDWAIIGLISALILVAIVVATVITVVVVRKKRNSPGVAGERLVIVEELGSGNFGRVDLALLDGSRRVVVKTPKTMNDRQEKMFLSECDIVGKLPPHENVVEFLGRELNPPRMIFEYCDGGDLRKLQGKVDVLQGIELILQISRGLEHLVNHGIIHRDISLANCLLSGNTVKIADFGLSRRLEENRLEGTTGALRNVPIRYMAPESLAGKSYSEKSDVWAFGLLIWELFTGKIAFARYQDDLIALGQAIVNGRARINSGQLPKPISELVEWCCQPLAANRPTFKEIRHRLENFPISD